MVIKGVYHPEPLEPKVISPYFLSFPLFFCFFPGHSYFIPPTREFGESTLNSLNGFGISHWFWTFCIWKTFGSKPERPYYILTCLQIWHFWHWQLLLFCISAYVTQVLVYSISALDGCKIFPLRIWFMEHLFQSLYRVDVADLISGGCGVVS